MKASLGRNMKQLEKVQEKQVTLKDLIALLDRDVQGL